MSTSLDLTFKVGDQVKFDRVGENTPMTFKASFGTPAEILHIIDSYAVVRWKHGPRYDDWTQSEVAFSKLRFGCHNDGAPFERTKLDEEGAFADGLHSGLAIGLAGEFYMAGGPWVSADEGCRHQRQAAEFTRRNAEAWKRGWIAGQERAKMKKALDFTKPLRTVKDHRVVHYIGRLAPDSETHLINIGNGKPPSFLQAPVSVDRFGSFGRGNYEVVVENVPEPVTTVIRFRPDGFCLGADYRGPTTPEDILVTVTITEGMVTALEPNR